jgi:hypothetical protein
MLSAALEMESILRTFTAITFQVSKHLPTTSTKYLALATYTTSFLPLISHLLFSVRNGKQHFLHQQPVP